MSDFEDDIDDQLLALAGATDKKKRRRQPSGASGSGSSKKRRAEYVYFCVHLPSALWFWVPERQRLKGAC